MYKVKLTKETWYRECCTESFDYQRFAREGEDYLLKKYGDELGRAQIEHSDIAQERRLAEELVKTLNPIKVVPSFADIRRLMLQGYVVGCNINSRILNRKRGYAGHFVIVTRINDDEITVHDPGLPPYPNREVPKGVFDKAWGYPSEDSKNVIAFRLSTSNE